jgi:hypothetical protein
LRGVLRRLFFFNTFLIKLSDAPSFSSLDIPCTNFPGPGAGHHMTKATFNPVKEFIHHTDEHVTKGFDEFITAHNKKYEHEKEVQMRLDVFRHNFRFIHSTNRRGLTYRLGVNHLTDRTEDEIRVRGFICEVFVILVSCHDTIPDVLPHFQPSLA